jgi:lipase chaperone LimK
MEWDNDGVMFDVTNWIDLKGYEYLSNWIRRNYTEPEATELTRLFDNYLDYERDFTILTNPGIIKKTGISANWRLLTTNPNLKRILA